MSCRPAAMSGALIRSPAIDWRWCDWRTLTGASPGSLDSWDTMNRLPVSTSNSSSMGASTGCRTSPARDLASPVRDRLLLRGSVRTRQTDDLLGSLFLIKLPLFNRHPIEEDHGHDNTGHGHGEDRAPQARQLGPNQQGHEHEHRVYADVRAHHLGGQDLSLIHI